MDIIPNWHPIFVQFTVSLFTTSVVFSIASYVVSYRQRKPKFLGSEFAIVGRWCLWWAALITFGTVLAGLYAFNTVNHDDVSHGVMSIHRKWALLTVTAIFLTTGFSVWNYCKQKKLSLIFIIALLITQILLCMTVRYGWESVYRYGIGVKSIPKADNTKGHHHHD